MDTSETYIKMCDCEEIQEYNRAKDVPHNIFVCSNHHLRMDIDLDDFIYHAIKSKEKVIWLPRQDQLQEMVPSNLGSTQPNFKMISELNHFYDYWDTNGIPNYLTTWEQLWFAFVMKENHNKVWDGEKWK